MGLDVPELVIGVSLGTLDTLYTEHTSPFNVFILGMPKSRWKLVQISGRLGRKLGEKAIFITVVPEKQVVRGVLNIHCEQCCCNGIFFLLTK